VERAPGVLPAGLDRLARDLVERLAQAALAVDVGVGDQLEALGRLQLLEARRNELQKQRPRLLAALEGNADRDPAEPFGQRNAARSLSRKPSSGR
jgi:hypothetical protein